MIRVLCILFFLIAGLAYSTTAQSPDLGPSFATGSDLPNAPAHDNSQPSVSYEGGVAVGQGSFAPGSTVPISAQPIPGYRFERWEGRGVDEPQAANTTLTLEGYHFLKPIFTREWNLIVRADPAEAAQVSGSGQYEVGEVVPISAQPTGNATFLGWEGPGVEDPQSLNTTVTILDPEEQDIIARFEQEDQDDQQNQDQQQDQNQDQQSQDQHSQDQESQDSESSENQDQQSQEQQSRNEQSESEPSEEGQQNEQNEESPEQEQTESPDPSQRAQEQANEEEGAENPEGASAQPQTTQPILMTREQARQLLEALRAEEEKLPLGMVVEPANAEEEQEEGRDW